MNRRIVTRCAISTVVLVVMTTVLLWKLGPFWTVFAFLLTPFVVDWPLLVLRTFSPSKQER